MLGTNLGTLLRHTDSEKIILGPKFHISHQYDDLDEVRCYECSDTIRYEERHFEGEFALRLEQTLCSACDWDYDELYYDFEPVENECADYHPLNQLPSYIGISRAAYDKIADSEHNYAGRDCDMWTPTRNRAYKSRSRSQQKRHWRRYQQARELSKSVEGEIGIEAHHPEKDDVLTHIWIHDFQMTS